MDSRLSPKENIDGAMSIAQICADDADVRCSGDLSKYRIGVGVYRRATTDSLRSCESGADVVGTASYPCAKRDDRCLRANSGTRDDAADVESPGCSGNRHHSPYTTRSRYAWSSRGSYPTRTLDSSCVPGESAGGVAPPADSPDTGADGPHTLGRTAPNCVALTRTLIDHGV
jgi:hypothetical protein